MRMLLLPLLLTIYKRRRILRLVDYLQERDMAGQKTDLLQGTLDLLILKILALGPTHGWDITQRIQQISEDVLRVNQGSLYPALHRLEAHGWITAEWGESENNRRAKYYRLTAAGRRQLADERETWARFSCAVERILQTT